MPCLLALAVLGSLALPAASTAAGPRDMFPPEVMAKITDRSTLNPRVAAHLGWYDVYFDSEIGDAKWGDSEEPYEVHTGGTIRIHGYLAAPLFGGPYPGIVIGHGHGGTGAKELAIAVAALGYVALSIDGPMAGESTGGPQDTDQAWISVEERFNEPSPTVGFLYHYAYAGMRAITLLDRLSRLPFNPLHIDRTRFGVIGASMGGQFTYFLNAVDPRVKGAVAIAVAGDWRNLLFYEGSWLYHGLYYYTRDGLASGNDWLNAITNVCPGVRDPTLETFVANFDPIAHAPTQHGPLLTIIGTHDQYFTVPAINTTYDRVASAGTNPRFIKRIMMTPNGKHGVIDENRLLRTVLPVLADIHNWFRYSFRSGAAPPATPTVRMSLKGDRMVFRVAAPAGSSSIRRVLLHWATQIDTRPESPCDFRTIQLKPVGGEYVGAVRLGARPTCGPEATPERVLYYASVKDAVAYTVSSKMYYGFSEMAFGSDFVPIIEHFPDDEFPVPPVPDCVPQ